jgi:plasmid stabilization system protein ParE
MPRIKVSESAQIDIQRLHQFLAKSSPPAALRAVQTIRQAFKPLREHPEIGRPVEDEPGLRELIIVFGSSAYLALYQFERGDELLVILTVRHQLELQYPERENQADER